MHNNIVFSLVIPVYKNEDGIASLLERTTELYNRLGKQLEVIFVVDRSPDNSFQLLERHIPNCIFPAELINLSRNSGPSAALKMGLSIAKGKYFASMSADLQEPIELIINLFQSLENGKIDIAVGKRLGRNDPALSKIWAGLFWKIYRKFVQPDMPAGGIDTIAINKKVRSVILTMEEANTSLAGQFIWLGFHRQEIPYKRQARTIGKSSWSFKRKFRYMLDSMFSFTDLPITLIIAIGTLGLFFSLLLGINVLIAWYLGNTPTGYTTLILVILFTFSLTLISLGIIGNYIWRTYENTKNRPSFILMDRKSFPKK